MAVTTSVLALALLGCGPCNPPAVPPAPRPVLQAQPLLEPPDVLTSTPPIDEDGDGYSPELGDCNDHDPTVHYGAYDTLGDRIDSNCDGLDQPTLAAGVAVATFQPEMAMTSPLGCGGSLSTAELTGDSSLDILVSCPEWIYSTSVVYVMQGGPDLASVFDSPLAMSSTRGATDGFGRVMSNGLDASGDGLPDVLISSTLDPQAYLVSPIVHDGWWGIADALAYTSGAMLPYTEDTVGASLWPDTNGDGVAELLTAVSSNDRGDLLVLHESPHSGELLRDQGTELAALDWGQLGRLWRTADLDGDGLPELVSSQRGGLLLLDTQSDPIQTWTLNNPENEYGVFNVASGDLNGDGSGDLLIPLVQTQVGDNLSVGAVYMLSDLPIATTTDFTEGGPLITGVGAYDAFGQGLLVQDVNGDGQDDLVVGSGSSIEGEPGPGRLHVFFGPILAPLTAIDADLIISGDYPGMAFGYSVAAADIDGDGLMDLAVGAPASDEAYPDAGKVYLFDGRDLWP